MKQMMQKFDTEDCSIFFNDEDCKFQTEFDILGFDNSLGDLCAEIDKNHELLVEIDTNEGSYGFQKKFHCKEHALEFCNRNLSKDVSLGYLLFGLNWDQVYM